MSLAGNFLSPEVVVLAKWIFHRIIHLAEVSEDGGWWSPFGANAIRSSRSRKITCTMGSDWPFAVIFINLGRRYSSLA